MMQDFRVSKIFFFTKVTTQFAKSFPDVTKYCNRVYPLPPPYLVSENVS